ncbi:MAG: glutamine amidotransferase [Betaproteobacteria bacterium CG2_30_59_46]|nr:MAG: glutamine amidotransferase [Betaproteobacteria bacterium CG2_30_59_46]PIQ11198.1 MAG: glutamine amidotransferase [Hydrogenophilales bacterium CG18_big_fil_WC_8_21_14_2_50_58_12]PIX99870.1 MAG: glutamine amidotransferase [Hydrogenophilales bacterium CG_4_10_14_3_um_filter_58_23]PJB08908.1 MAG: glutamine amidotransferase [Hydrogenophilales bacterium CG_4_9_14_3_um_filter_59_35]
MKPVAIFRHAPSEGPGYFATFLDSHDIPWQLFRVDAGDTLPADARQFSGLVFMGGPMSVNDDLPWIPHSLELIRQAAQAGIPVLGHCLGGQLMAKALGGVVGRNPVKEIGWGEVVAADNATARTWFGETRNFDAFHWHGETFTIPPGATVILGNSHCANQAFALGKNLAMQCHIEMTEEMVREWCELGMEEIASASTSPAVQQPAEIMENLAERVNALNTAAQKIYKKWVEGLVR